MSRLNGKENKLTRLASLCYGASHDGAAESRAPSTEDGDDPQGEPSNPPDWAAMIPAPSTSHLAAPIDWSQFSPRSMPPSAPPRRQLPPAEAEKLRKYREDLDRIVYEEQPNGRYKPYVLSRHERNRLLEIARQGALRGRPVPKGSRAAIMAAFRSEHRELMLLLKGRSTAHVAQEAGMHRRQIWMILLGAWDPGAMKVRTLARVARGLKCDLTELLQYLTEAHKRYVRGEERRRAKKGKRTP